MSKAKLLVLACLVASLSAQGVDGRVTSWRLNVHNTKGQSPSATIQAIVGVINADVQQVQYNTTHVFAQCTGVPSYPIGPWPSNPNVPANALRWYRIPRNPVQAATPTATPLGPIGVLVNGVTIFNPKDAFSYNNQGVWFRNAIIVEGPSFDSALGHPAPMGQYHNHQRSVALAQQMNDNGTHHSPILGFAFDGYPVYGSYGYTVAGAVSAPRRMASSWRLRNITTRTTLPNGTVLSAAQYGPPVSSTYPLGYFIEDFEYVAGLGDLDQFNGRSCVTPEFPGGTYAYFMTIDAAGSSAFPYIMGPTYRGVVDNANLGTGAGAIPPAGTTIYNPTVMELGAGCLGPNGDPLKLSTNGSATLGNAGFAFTLANGPSGGQGFIFLATSVNRLPAPIVGSCVLFLELNSMLALANAGVSPLGPVILDGAGSGTFAIPIPANASLMNAVLDVQASIHGTSYAGTSNGLTLRLH